MKQALQPNPDNQPALPSQIIKTVLPVVGICLVLGGGGLVAVFSQKPKTEKATQEIIQPIEIKTEQIKPELPPQLPPYTLFVEGDKVIVKFHGNDSDIHFSHVTNEQKVCLANGGGIGCVLPGYVAQNKSIKDTTKSTPKTEKIKRQTWKIPEIEASANTMDNIMLIGGVVIGLILIDRFRKK